MELDCDLRGCSTVQKIVIEIVFEIGIEQARLFECDRFHYTENWQSPSRLFWEIVTSTNQY